MRKAQIRNSKQATPYLLLLPALRHDARITNEGLLNRL